MKTKAELIETMRQLNACQNAIDYVTEHPSEVASEIWRNCDDIDWMIWLAGRLRPDLIAKFARDCANRTNDEIVHAGANYAGAYAAKADGAADAAAYAGYAAYHAAHGAHTVYEWDTQLKDLHALGALLFKDE